MHFGISSFEARDGGVSSVIIDIRYMWSEMDSPWLMPKRRQPSRFVVLRRSRRWKKGKGEVEFVIGWEGRVERTVWGVHWSSAWEGVKTPEDEAVVGEGC